MNANAYHEAQDNRDELQKIREHYTKEFAPAYCAPPLTAQVGTLQVLTYVADAIYFLAQVLAAKE